MSENVPPQGRVPRQQSVTSASRLPRSSPPVSTSPQMASVRYVKQFQTLMEHQRHVFDEERALWNTERNELHEKIAQLEGSLRRYQTISSSQASSPISDSNREYQGNRLWSLVGKDGPFHPSAATTGDEVWRGPKPDLQPTRTFSDPTPQSAKPIDQHRLPSIAEDTTCGRKDSSDLQPGLHKPNMSSIEIDRNLDGINFKSSTLPPAPVKSSPPLSPRTIHMPPSKLEAPDDPYTKNAGHTPIARRTYFNGDDASSEGIEATPTQPEVERPPLEPHASFSKLPSERSDSYFPVVEDDYLHERNGSDDQKDSSQLEEDESRDEDPELQGPLGLENSNSSDKQFLNELDSKLRKAAKSDASSRPSVGVEKEDSAEGDWKDFEQPEHEPKLRIKRSMNFGSAFGAKTCGKGI